MGTQIFRHVRYAQAVRFGLPVLADYDESLTLTSADTQPAACPQTPFRLGFVMGDEQLPQSEDCHFLNIYTPSRKGSRPVLVWLHGPIAM